MCEFITLIEVEDVGEGDGFSGVAVIAWLFEGEEVVIGEDAPSSEEAGRYLRQLFSTRDSFSRVP